MHKFKVKIHLTILFILISLVSYGQDYFVGDILKDNKEKKVYKKTEIIYSPNVTFKEKEYSLYVNRLDLINALESYKTGLDSSYNDFKKRYDITINYLQVNQSTSFDYMWSRREANEVSWDKVDSLDAHTVSEIVLKELLCEIIAVGKFQIIEKGKEQKTYFFERVDSNYGGNVNGVFSKSKRMIWICPPFIME